MASRIRRYVFKRIFQDGFLHSRIPVEEIPKYKFNIPFVRIKKKRLERNLWRENYSNPKNTVAKRYSKDGVSYYNILL
ncbi:hypothetical protein JTE90_005269 [Oedothorax gibbosus]|uniref:Uncharacterized protein n=1 Tax=Oedothorax gibbosus TaxID=931172 RepID=A0AAV6U489_9ARAC|nr:hypothetical protein JTE90_005269 [Oedothorax gibbosus]